jgi:hypothetical protein
MPKQLAALSALCLGFVASPASAQQCLHGASETADQAARTREALAATRNINNIQANQPGAATGQYLRYDQLSSSPFALLKLLTACLCLFSIAAPALGQDTMRLRFAAIKDGVPITTFELAVISNAEGSIEIPGAGRVVFTPSFRDSDHLRVVFAIQFDSSFASVAPMPTFESRPTMVVARNNPGRLYWAVSDPARSVERSFQLVVSWVR